MIFGYSREREFSNVLRLCIENSAPVIFINFDFPGSRQIELAQQRMLREVEQARESHPEISIVCRRSRANLGAAHSIISGIDWFFQHHDFGLVLEDDLTFTEDLFLFVSSRLALFNNLQDAWIISGSNFFAKSGSDSSSLVNFPVTWGWATTRNKWLQMRSEMLKFPTLSSIKFFSKKNFWWLGSRRSHKGFIDAWDLPLAWAMQRNVKYSLLPPVNLVSNIGFSDRASNTIGLQFPLNLPIGAFGERNSTDAMLERNRHHEKLLLKYVYRVNALHRFSFIFSVFDFLRFTPKRLGSLNSRLNSYDDSDYIYL